MNRSRSKAKKVTSGTSRSLLKEIDPVLKGIIINNKFYSTNRGLLGEILFPTIVPTGVQKLHCTHPKVVTDIKAVSRIPSRSVCEHMLETLNGGNYAAVTCSLGTYTSSSIETLLKIHSLREISQQVKEETFWLARTPSLPNNQCVQPGFIDVYKKWLFDNSSEKVILDGGILPYDLATVTSGRWLTMATINGFINLFNAHDNNTTTAAFMLNDLTLLDNANLQRYASLVSRGRKIKAIVFVISVAGGIKKTDVATPKKPGCHWSLLYIDADANKWFYCDTLGWPVPDDLITTVNKVLNVFALEFAVFKKPAQGRFVAHKAEGNCHGFHQCTDGCFKNVPLQTCGSVCGVIVVIMGAISCLNPTLWRSCFLESKAFVCSEISWMKNPSSYSCYLRRVLIHWISSKNVELRLLGIEPCLAGKPLKRNPKSSNAQVNDCVTPPKKHHGINEPTKEEAFSKEAQRSYPDLTKETNQQPLIKPKKQMGEQACPSDMENKTATVLGPKHPTLEENDKSGKGSDQAPPLGKEKTQEEEREPPQKTSYRNETS